MSYVGKYVCHTRLDGGACWGRIKSECQVNTLAGLVDAFILEDRYVRYLRTADKRAFRWFYPDAVMEHGLRKPMEVKTLRGPDGKPLKDDGGPLNKGGRNRLDVAAGGGVLGFEEESYFFFEVSKIRGDSTLHVSSIDLDKDVVDVGRLVDIVDQETLFRAFTDARLSDPALAGASALEIGLRHLLDDTRSPLSNVERDGLREALQKKLDKLHKGENDAESNDD